MIDDTPRRSTSRRRGPLILGAVLVLLSVNPAGAADRVVLGEYFTNLF